jgi:membrane-associated phospholipid phosphatase
MPKTDVSPESPVSRPVHRYRARLFQIYIILAALGFGVLFFYARTVPYFEFDVPVSHAIQAMEWSGVDSLMIFISNLGYPPISYLWSGTIIVVLALMGLRWEAFMSLTAMGIALIGYGIKLLVERPRPTPNLVNVFAAVSDSSFPSGHVLFFTAFLGFVFFLLYTLAPRSWWRIAGMFLTGGLIVLVGISRIYLGQHWTSDVLGAYLLASLWLALVIYVYRRGKRRRFLERK